MGRAMLIIVSGVFIAYSIFFTSAWERQKINVGINADYAYEGQSTNILYAGLELALQKISDDPDWKTTYGDPAVFDFNFGETVATITIIDNTAAASSDTLNITATSSLDQEREITVIVEKNYLENYPPVNGAFSIDPNNIDFKASGNSFNVNGNDTNFDASAGPADPLPGMTVRSNNAKSDITSELTAQQVDNIQGSTGNPSIEVDPAIATQDFSDFLDFYITNADNFVDGGTKGESTYGTIEIPEITIVSGDVKFNGNVSGAGIMVMKKGSKVNLKGNFTFYGLVLQEGDSVQVGADSTIADLNTKINGNVSIYGGTIVDSPASVSSLKLNMKGNVSLYYSSAGLKLLNKIFDRKNFASGFNLLSIYE